MKKQLCVLQVLSEHATGRGYMLFIVFRISLDSRGIAFSAGMTPANDSIALPTAEMDLPAASTRAQRVFIMTLLH